MQPGHTSKQAPKSEEQGPFKPTGPRSLTPCLVLNQTRPVFMG